MRVVHNSRTADYRSPYGALQLGRTLRLALDVWDSPDVECSCRMWIDGVGETVLPMEHEVLEDRTRFSVEIVPKEPEIIWYTFFITLPSGEVLHYGAQEGRVGGEGAMSPDPMPPSFQVTVYRERAHKPSWYTGGVVYQIFPDRFCRGEGWRDLVDGALALHRHGPGRHLCEDWYETPRYDRDENGRIRSWEFYGGTLSGVREKLDYLADLGVTAIYLNPIFEAASNHRYDTGDYLKVDPMLGDTAEFEHLCSEAAKRGIYVILDGVFNHTGCDSRYFNKYANYAELGAYQSEDSRYRSWYTIGEDGKTYCSWWGVDDLPDANEDDPSYQKFICTGRDSVVRRWLRSGARGWRLDVADELPDEFIALIKKAVVETREDGLLLGEVWEDASNKISYGKLRRYLLGDELDSAMNYPLRDALTGFLLGTQNAWDVAETLESLRENYPPDALADALDLIGSHDRMRILTQLGGAPDPATMSDEDRANYRLDEGQRGLAKGRLWLAVLAQMTLPGVPSIYYGDEAGLEGYADPYNRAGYPWGKEDPDTLAIHRNAISLRRVLPFLATGGFEPFACNDDVLGFWRTGDSACAAVLENRSLSNTHVVEIPLRGEEATELVSGRGIEVDGDMVRVTLPPLGSAVVYCHDSSMLGSPMEKGVGVLCHITSVPAPGDHGTLGAPSLHFCDLLSEAGVHYWQVLPVNPTDQFGSPYAGISAFAGNTRLLDTGDHTLRELYQQFSGGDEFERFCDQNSGWLAPYATFMALRDAHPECLRWQEWPERLHAYNPELVAAEGIADDVRFHEFCQFEFERQWDELHRHAREAGISIIGDMPMYVSEDSADVWANQDLFCLDASGEKSSVAGVPPDYFSETGQLWGNPLYRWDTLRATGYAWWIARLRRAFSLYDYVRLDHFRGFEAYWSVPAGHPAIDGTWLPGPGVDLFEAARSEFGPLPVIAEDLGLITPAVRALVAACGFPGMDVLQFYDGDPRQGYVPMPGRIAYSGTHDNQTLVGWCRGRYVDVDPRQVAYELMQSVLASDAGVAVIPLQDVLGLGDEARMNVPGEADGNWRWQAETLQVEEGIVGLRRLLEETCRV